MNSVIFVVLSFFTMWHYSRWICLFCFFVCVLYFVPKILENVGTYLVFTHDFFQNFLKLEKSNFEFRITVSPKRSYHWIFPLGWPPRRFGPDLLGPTNPGTQTMPLWGGSTLIKHTAGGARSQ